MDLYKIITVGDKVYIRTLVYNERVWSGRQWSYSYVKIDAYPTDNEEYATDFKTVEAAVRWIKEHTPN